MSKKVVKDNALLELYVSTFKMADKQIRSIASLEEKMFRNYQNMIIDKQEELNSTPKLFKKKRAKLEQDLKDLQIKADKHYKKFIQKCDDLYDLHTSIINENKEDNYNG